MTQSRARLGTIGAVAAASMVFALFLSGCSADASPEQSSSARGGTLTVGITQPETLNPAKALSSTSMTVCLPYDALIAENSDGTFSPRLAVEWGYADDENKVYELTIREDVTFSDGDPLNAEAVAASLNYVVAEGSSSFSGLTAVATAENTVQIISPTPQPDFEILLTEYFAGGCIISPTGLADPDKLETESHGVGPYIIESVSTGVEIVYTANEDYYDQTRVNYDEIVFKVYGSDTAATQALMSGQISFWRSDLGQTWNDLVASNGDLSLYTGSPNFGGIWIFDQQGQVTPALADIRVRQALNYAIDREPIAEAIYGPDATARVQPANWNWNGFDEELESTYTYDPDKARTLLEEAGYEDGFTLPIAYYGASLSDQNLGEALKSNLADVGITVELHSVATVSDLRATYRSGTVSAALTPVDARSVFQYVNDRHGTGGNNGNALGQVDDELMAMVESAAVENTEETWSRVLEWLTDNAFGVPVVQRALVYLVADEIDITDGYLESSGRVDYASFRPAR